MKTYHIEVYYDDDHTSIWFTVRDQMNAPGHTGRKNAEEIYYKLADQFKYVSLIETETIQHSILN